MAFVPQSLLIKAGSNQVYSFLFQSALLFSEPFENEAVQSIVMSASVPERKIYNLSDAVVTNVYDQSANKTNKNKISTCQFWVLKKNGICAVSDFIFPSSTYFEREIFKSTFLFLSLMILGLYLNLCWVSEY